MSEKAPVKRPRGRPKGSKSQSGRVGGAATGGGMNFQEALTALAGVHLLRGAALGWLEALMDDIPTAVSSETAGAGDDIRLELRGGQIIEVQAKRGLKRNAALWKSLLALAAAVQRGDISAGVLAIAPDSSDTIKDKLATDLRRLGEGRFDGLSDIGKDLEKRIRAEGLPVEAVCSRLRIQVVHALSQEKDAILRCKEMLRAVCARPDAAADAWDKIYIAAGGLVERRGRWRLGDLLAILESAGIALQGTGSPAALASRLRQWTLQTCAHFDIPGAKGPIPLSRMLPQKTMLAAIDAQESATADVALERYFDHTAHRDPTADSVFDAEWTGRFFRLSVVVAGPGLGKSTLITRLAAEYASAGFVVLRFPLKAASSALRAGKGFEQSVITLGLDGSSISPDDFAQIAASDIVVLADGLDDCGDQHQAVAEGLVRLAAGWPRARFVVTTRPVGYETKSLASWRHYVLCPPEADQGERNLSKLIDAVSEDGFNDAATVAKRELAATAAKPAIVRSPQLLGMAASLIAKKGALPQSRSDLYQRVLELFEASGLAKGGTRPSGAIAHMVIGILGRRLVEDPLLPAATAEAAVAAELAAALGPTATSLSVSPDVEACVRFWEGAGLLERLHHGGTAYLTFVHKSLAEFTAAQDVLRLGEGPRSERLAAILQSAPWAEVVSFAGGLGAGDTIAGLFVGLHQEGQSGRFEQALGLISDPNARLSPGRATQLVQQAFAVIEAGADDRFSVGAAVADLASTAPEIVGPIATSLLSAPNADVRLCAWAAVVAASPETYEPDRILDVMRPFAAAFAERETTPLLGGMVLHHGKDRDLIQRLALAAASRVDKESFQDFVDRELAAVPFGNVGFLIKLEGLAARRGLSLKSRLRLGDTRAQNRARILDPGTGWDEAGRAIVSGIAVAVGGSAEHAPPAGPGALVQFGGLLQVTDFMGQIPRDFYPWGQDYDREGVSEVFRLVVGASALDADRLAAEASTLLARLESEPNLSLFQLDFPVPDVPKLRRDMVSELQPDLSRITSALAMRSSWLADLAASLLEDAAIDRSVLEELVETGTGWPALVAAHLLGAKWGAQASSAILSRLDHRRGRDDRYLLEALRQHQPAGSPELLAVLRDRLLGDDVEVASVAAELCCDLVTKGTLASPDLMAEAFKYWREHERPTPSTGVVPTSPRATLLRGLLRLRAIPDARLVDLLSDTRFDVVRSAQAAISASWATNGALREAFISAAQERCLGPATAASTLKALTHLAAEDLERMTSWLDDPDPAWRRAAMTLLDVRFMPVDRIREHATRLSADQHDEIRRVATRLLKDTQ